MEGESVEVKGESVTVNGESVTVNGESAEVKGESVEVNGESAAMAAGLEVKGESAAMAEGPEVKDESVIIDSQVSGSKLPALSVYKERDKILCDLCGKGYAKTGIARHRKMCINKQANSKNEVKEEARETGAVKVVPVEVEEPPPPPPLKLERQPSAQQAQAHAKRESKSNAKGKAYSREEALESEEADEYAESEATDGQGYAVAEPVAPGPPAVPQAVKPLTRVDKMRMLARSGLPK